MVTSSMTRSALPAPAGSGHFTVLSGAAKSCTPYIDRGWLLTPPGAAYRLPTFAANGGEDRWRRMDSAGRSPRLGLPRRIMLGLVLCICAAGGGGRRQLRRIRPSHRGRSGRNTVTIEHGAIPGLLPAAQSEFPLQGGAPGVHPGDRVRFTLGAMDDSHGLLTIVSLAPEQGFGSGWPSACCGRGGGLRPPYRRGGRDRRSALAGDADLPAPDGRARSRGGDAPGPRDRHAGQRAPDRPGPRGGRHGLPRRLCPGAPTAARPRGRAARPADPETAEPAETPGAIVVVQRGTGRPIPRRRRG